MKKLLGLGVIFLIIISISACTPTKEEILDRMENVDAYTYVLSMKIVSPYGIFTIKDNEGIDKSKNISFSEYESISRKTAQPAIKNTTMKIHSWEFFDGEYEYGMEVITEDSISRNESHKRDLNDLKYLLKDFLPANASREDVIQFIITQRDYISTMLVPLLENATIEETERKWGYYILRFTVDRNGSMENISGEMRVVDGLPTELHILHVGNFIDPSSNKTYTITKEYNVTFDYRFEVPEWAKKLREDGGGAP